MALLPACLVATSSAVAKNPIIYDAALEGLSPQAGQGDARHQLSVGKLNFLAGDHEEAVMWFRLAAGQDHTDAFLSLGWMYEEGIGVPQDYKRALKWYRMAAGPGLPLAQVSLGFMYEHGLGVAQDLAEAKKWYRLAAGQDHTAAFIKLGLMYEEGIGATQNYKPALQWFRMADEHDNHATQMRLYYGEEIPYGYAQAYMWLNVEAGKLDEANVEDLVEEIRNLTPDQVEKAGMLARECVASSYRDC